MQTLSTSRSVSPRSIQNEDLFTRIKRLVATERRIGIEILECLHQIDLRKAYAELRYDGLFTYCVKELGFTDSQAYQRIQAMRALKEMPELKEKIESGALSVSSVAKVQTHFRRERKAGVVRPKAEKLALFRVMENGTSREVDTKLAEIRGVPPLVRFFVEMDTELVGLWQAVRDRAAHRSGGSDAEAMKIVAREWLARNDPGREIARKSKTTDLAAEKSKEVRSPAIEVPAEMIGSAAVIRRAVPSPTQVTARRARFISAATRREVWRRDGGKCSRCGSRHALEIDHRRPFAMGGEADVDNLRLLCRSCNRFAAIRVFGFEKIGPYKTR